MALPALYKGIKPTKFTKADYETKFAQRREQYLKQFPELAGRNNINKLNKKIYKSLGYPRWNIDGDPASFAEGGQLYNINQGKARLRDNRINTNKKSNNQRQQWIDNANALSKPEDVQAGQNKQKEIRKKANRTGDHDFEAQEFGPILDQLEAEKEAGLISDEEYKKRKKIYKDRNPGDVEANIVDRHWAVNSKKEKQVKAKNKALENMENRYPSKRHLKNFGFIALLKSKLKTKNLTGITAVLTQEGYTTNFNSNTTNGETNGHTNGKTNGHTNGHTNGKVTNGESTKVPTNGKTNGFKNGGKKIVLNGNKTNNYRGLSTLMEQPNTWSDPLLMTPVFRTLDKSIDVSL